MTMTEILFAGDTHGRLQHVVDAALKLRPAAVVLLGDIESPRPLDVELKPLTEAGVEVAWIPGNHDSDREVTWDNLVKSGLADRNLHGRVLEIAGVRIAGLGAVFRETIWMPPADWSYESISDFEVRSKGDRHLAQKLLTHSGTIFPDVYHGLAGQRADILICHEAPSCHPSGYAAVDELARALGAHTVVHGHHHDRLDYSADTARLGFRTLGVGLRGLTTLDGTIVRPGDLDEQRAHRSRSGIKKI